MIGRRLAAGLSVVVSLAACAETTVDTVESTAEPTALSTTVPTGSTEELLTRLIAETAGLSERVVEDEGQEEALARIEALWAAAAPGVEAARPDLVDQFDAAMDYARRAVERRRPADADKAALNLQTLLAAL